MGGKGNRIGSRGLDAPSESKLAPSELAGYLCELGGALLAYGCPTQRLEGLLRAVARLEGHEVEAFALPTGLFVALSGPGLEAPLVRMVRVEDWGVNLDRLLWVDQILNDVAARRISLPEGRARLHDIEQRPAPYPRWVGFLAATLSTGSAAVFFRANLREMAVAALGGLLLTLVGLLSRKNRGLRFLENFLGGMLAGGLAWGATWLWPSLSREVLVLSVVILLVPGMTFTTGLAELTYRNLVSGTARLMDALIVLLSLLFGIALVVGLESRLGLTVPSLPEPHLPATFAVQALAMVVAALSFGVLLSLPVRFLPAAIGSAGIGWFVMVATSDRGLPGHMAAFGAALAVCLYANGCARFTQRPAQLFLLPGLILLVPGSFGFRSLEALLRGDVLGGAAQGFDMFLVAGALVIGILVANVLLPARKFL